MSEILKIVVLLTAAIALPASPSQPNYVYIAETKTNSLAGSVLAVESVPEIPPLKIALDENEGEKVALDDFGTSEDLKRATERRNEEKKVIEDWIKQYSAQYSVSYEEMRRVMMCESGGKIDAVGDNGKAFGLFQFWFNTFQLFAKDLGEELDYKNPEHQIKLASWAFSKGTGYKKHWACYTKIAAR